MDFESVLRMGATAIGFNETDRRRLVNMVLHAVNEVENARKQLAVIEAAILEVRDLQRTLAKDQSALRAGLLPTTPRTEA